MALLRLQFGSLCRDLAVQDLWPLSMQCLSQRQSIVSGPVILDIPFMLYNGCTCAMALTFAPRALRMGLSILHEPAQGYAISNPFRATPSHSSLLSAFAAFSLIRPLPYPPGFIAAFGEHHAFDRFQKVGFQKFRWVRSCIWMEFSFFFFFLTFSISFYPIA